MKNITVQMLGFENPHPELNRFHDSPRLSLQQTFARIAQTLPDQAAVTFYQNEYGVAACIHPYAGQDEPKLSYQFHPDYQSVIIRRIHAGDKARKGLGTAMIASQLPLWRALGAAQIGVLAHGGSAGFYEKLGFAPVHMLPEYPWSQQCLLTPMRLDLQNPTQDEVLTRACAKVRPLTDPAFRL